MQAQEGGTCVVEAHTGKKLSLGGGTCRVEVPVGRRCMGQSCGPVGHSSAHRGHHACSFHRAGTVGSPTQSAPAKVQTVQGSGGGRWRLSLSRQRRAFLRSHVSTFQLEVIVLPGTAQFRSAVARFFLRACWSHRWKFPSNRRMSCRASLPRGSAQGGILSPIPSRRLYLDLKIIREEANAIKTIQPGGNSG